MSASSFGPYAACYDLLNRGKDYAAEAGFVDGLLRAAGVARGALLDVGCGTGAHAREFAARGWQVTGVDLSAEMIARARAQTPDGAGIEDVTGAAADCSRGRTVAAVVSLFHVVSYQAAEGEAARMFANVRGHLATGGVFVFDFWHGPGVLADPPGMRERRAEEGSSRVLRVARPTHRPEERRIDVDYAVEFDDGVSGRCERFTERHRLRYFFLPELTAALAHAGLAVEQTRAGLSAEPLTAHAWYGLMVARAV